MRKIICLILSIIMIVSMVGCSNKNESTPPFEHETIYTNDNEGMKVAKSAKNQLIDFWNKDIGITYIENNPNNSITTYILREKGNEIMYSSDLSYLAIQKKNGENYILHINNTFEKINEKLPRLITDTYKRNIILISWMLEDTDKYTWIKNVNNDNTISYFFTTEDISYYVEKYKQYFNGHEFLSVYDKCFETTITVDLDGNLVQIDWVTTNKEETIVFETATRFTNDIEAVYALMGDGIENIWNDSP